MFPVAIVLLTSEVVSRDRDLYFAWEGGEGKEGGPAFGPQQISALSSVPNLFRSQTAGDGGNGGRQGPGREWDATRVCSTCVEEALRCCVGVKITTIYHIYHVKRHAILEQ